MSSLAPTYFTIPEIIFDQGLGPAENSSQREPIDPSLLGKMLRLPDLDTRRGLRKMHKQFEDIYARLHLVYVTAKDRSFPLVMASVVNFMIKMNVDVILREKLFQQGLLQKVMSLLDYDETRLLALQTLLAFTYYEGRSYDAILKGVVSQNGALSHLIQAHPTDPVLVEVIITAMAHATLSALDVAHSPNHLTADEIYLIPTQARVISSLREPANYRLGLLTHALQLLVAPTHRFPKECQAIPSLSSLLVAFLRSRDVMTRALSLIGIFNLSRVGTGPDHQEVQLERLDNALRCTIPMPGGLADVPPEDFLELLQRSHAMMLYASSLQYLSAVTQAARDRDYYTLGRKLHILFQHCPSVPEGSWRELEERAGIRGSTTPEGGVSAFFTSFTVYSDVLPECARALREKGDPSDFAAADVIDTKFLLLRNRVADAIVYATQVLERQPRMAFAKYVVSLGSDPEGSLRAAKEGLQCPDVTQFLRQQLLWRSQDLAGRKALDELLRNGSDVPGLPARQAESKALLATALDDAQVLVAELAPDSPLRLTILGWIIIVTLILRGDHTTLDDLNHVLEMIARTKELMQYFGLPLDRSDLYMASDLVVKAYTSGAEEWRSLVQSYDDLGARIDNFDPNRYGGLSTTFGVEHTSLLAQCSTCGSSSAALKKCKGCHMAR
ncbi:hypothetical protein LXA43DRAFT_1105429 [Ganoderma leucocontextum]|nr:hypothetical protein LXA43DRAFT_1105429 [Ganoderma leucocontextum]